MTADGSRGRRVGSALLLAGLAIALTAVIVIVAGVLGERPEPAASGAASGATSGGPSGAPSSVGTDAPVACRPEPEPLPSMLAGDPCPEASLAVKLAVAPVRLPVQRIVIEPGPFYCDVVWPGAQSPPICYGPVARPGQFMHAWVSFRGTDEVAAVMLGLDLPADVDQPGSTRPPWHATLVTVEVPPAGWVMP